MKEQIYQQISSEFKQATRLDMKIFIVSIVVTLLLFFIAMGFAASSAGSITGTLTGGLVGPRTATFHTAIAISMFVCILAIFVINWFSVRAILNNKKQRVKLTEGLMKLYKDEGVDQYYDGSIFKSYETRYNLFAVILATVGSLSIIIPLVIFINQVIKL
jgi:hypothetical protein